MVPGPRARESRAPLDSRPLDGKPSRGLFLYLEIGGEGTICKESYICFYF